MITASGMCVCKLCGHGIRDDARGAWCQVCLLRAAASPACSITNVIGQSEDTTTYLARDGDTGALIVCRIVRSLAYHDEFVARLAQYRRVLDVHASSPLMMWTEHGSIVQDNAVYAIRRYVLGTDIASYCVRSHADRQTRAGLLDAAERAVRRLHRCGLPHGRVKASNVLIVSTQSGPTPAIVDTGLHTGSTETDIAELAQLRAMLA